TPLDVDDSNAAQVGSIVRRLEGWPLALELAAAQVPVAGLDWMEAKAWDLSAVTATHRDRPRRHRTLNDVLEFTWALLHPSARKAWCQLAFFRGGFSFAAAGVVLDGPVAATLEQLRERGVVRRLVGAEVRFDMLETVRVFGRARIEDSTEVAGRHLAWARSLYDVLILQPPSDQTNALAAAELANLDLAFETAQARSDADALAEIALCTTRSAWWSGSLERTLERLLVALDANPNRAGLWHQAGYFAGRIGTLSDACGYLRRAIEVGEADGEPPAKLALGRTQLACLLARDDEHDAADELFERACRDSPPGSRAELAALSNWGVSLAARGLPQSVEMGERALVLCRESADEQTESIVLHNLARAYLAVGQDESALDSLGRALELARRDGSVNEALILCRLGEAWQESDVQHAKRFLESAIAVAERTGESRVLVEAHARLAQVCLRLGSRVEARRALGFAQSLHAAATAPVRRLVLAVQDQLRDVVRERQG
ncbi:MAG: tetratricopeptide repeat protein, partial [Myxococcota bacterium]